MKRLFAPFLVLATAWPAFSQSLTPAIVVQHDGKSESLGLTRLEVAVRIVGYLADTSVTMTFENPLPQATEGNFCFPLPDGATVSGYALDVQGKMVDGVSVERGHAREVFEQEKQRRVDPGLVEWTKGNWFRTRVFPIPARGRRTVRVQYISELVDERTVPAITCRSASVVRLASSRSASRWCGRRRNRRSGNRPWRTSGSPSGGRTSSPRRGSRRRARQGPDRCPAEVESRTRWSSGPTTATSTLPCRTCPPCRNPTGRPRAKARGDLLGRIRLAGLRRPPAGDRPGEGPLGHLDGARSPGRDGEVDLVWFATCNRRRGGS